MHARKEEKNKDGTKKKEKKKKEKRKEKKSKLKSRMECINRTEFIIIYVCTPKRTKGNSS